MVRRLLFLLCAASPALAQELDDRHLAVIPRTAEEAAWVAAMVSPPMDFLKAEALEASSAGAATVQSKMTADAFSQFSANMTPERQTDFKLGNIIFHKTWVAAPAATPSSDGLGPAYNARTCQDCHLLDGRGHVPEGAKDSRVSMFLRLSVPGGPAPEGISGWFATSPEPTYGSQLQDFATPGHIPEGQMGIIWREETVVLADGFTVSLRAPIYKVLDAGFGPLHPKTMLSPRVAPQMIGLGLLEAIPAADILALADPDDRNSDSISGQAQIVISAEYTVPMLGRFGMKAEVATIKEQSARAFLGDMGLSTVLFPQGFGDCTAVQTACRQAIHGQEPAVRDGVEVDAASLDLVTFYARNLGVPARRNVGDPTVLRGKSIFHDLNCAGCHEPKHVTLRLKDQPEQSFQLIWPYTDLLLHDMGAGLADESPVGKASGQEWKTPPLWGIGLTKSVSGHTQFLHDGRARTLLEAILWHGGEAQSGRDGVVLLPTKDRNALLAFLESL